MTEIPPRRDQNDGLGLGSELPVKRPLKVWIQTAQARLPTRDSHSMNEQVTVHTVRSGRECSISVTDLLFTSLYNPQDIDWFSSPHTRTDGQDPVIETLSPLLSKASKILCFIPHYACEKYLDRCLSSITRQTRPLDNIVVVHDGSDIPPVSIVHRYPTVTLLRSEDRVGPYCLLQSLMERVSCDAILLQDADDWSAVDRLELLLNEAERTGAAIVGSQVFRVFESTGEVSRTLFPTDVNGALLEEPCHCSQHSTNIIARKCVEEIGGLASGLRFGADTEFIFRAHFKFKIRNVPHCCYFRTIRNDSLTASSETGMESVARQELIRTLKSLARENSARHKAGDQPQLQPLRIRPNIQLKHICGPRLF
jgi:Glycosyl transferase family 2